MPENQVAGEVAKQAIETPTPEPTHETAMPTPTSLPSKPVAHEAKPACSPEWLVDQTTALASL